ncbi:plastin-2 isoform X1 [Parasteatoda tepidariorum]|uniref:plastin-2 isoform X1 n=1 Tax=Parasteatoda tepidariorum TaxID=114398 RepID=UPI000A2C0A01|nr:plastin-2 [Parasteatoda tepidariorum]
MANRRSFMLSHENLEDLCNHFNTLDKDGNGYLDVSELKQALEIVGFKIPQWQVRQMIDDMERGHTGIRKGELSFDDFQMIYSELKSKEVTNVFKTAVSKRENLQHLGGMSEASSEGTTHSVRHEEQVAFSDWINSNLGRDPDLKHLLPIDSEGKALYDKLKDGILLCKIINHSCPDTIDERVINKKNLTLYTKHENLTLALNSSQAIGCNVINIDAHDLAKGKPHLVLGLLWQIIRIGLFNQISLEHCPGLVQLVSSGEDMSDLMKLSPENILLRWVNYHLERAGSQRRITNFTTDIKDSEIYTQLLKQIAPLDSGVTLEPMTKSDLLERAEVMLKQADKIGCRSFLTPNDVIDGVYKLNVAFVANLFNNHPALDQPDEPIEMVSLEETREEKTYRNWMNSMGVSPYVNWLYSDLTNGLVIFQLYDTIKPGIVDWNRVHKTFSKLKAFMEKLENCNYAVLLGKELKFSLVGIAGHDISEGNPTLTLALVWQLMRAYTLTILTQLANTGHPVVEKEIVEWVNNKLKEAGKETYIRSFQDSSISTALPIINLIDSIQPGSINYSQVLTADLPEDRMANAKYAISMARKIGAKIYALPEDITEVKQKMVMTVFACLMARGYIPNMGDKIIEQ